MKTILVDAKDGLLTGDGKVIEEVYELLESYPNKKIILSNANDDQAEKLRLNKAPYQAFTLKHNPDKTDSEYYRKMLAHFGLETNDVVYFEHSQEAVESARSVGIKTYFYDSEKRDLVALKEFLEENL